MRSSPSSLPKDRSRARSASAFLENLPGAVVAPLPDRLAPQLGTLSKKLPTTGEWICEIKFDGYRILTRLEIFADLICGPHAYGRDHDQDQTQRLAAVTWATFL